MVCPSCGTENPEQAKFCFECASPLVAPASDPGTERKVVSVLFCDLVGFTSRSESADPEDVLATVRPYHALLRGEIEAFGGTVEKFIGDAVMAVFGAPVAHEDDAERAVRAGLRILESLEDLNEANDLDLSVRIGINTGEAVVSLGARPEAGEGIVTGDVVNTAARIQTGAPVGGIAVGETTYRTTKDVFDYEALEPISAKGKSEPVVAWRALSARARFGTDITRRHDTPLVGRDVERSLLQGLFERAVRDRSCQLVTIVGEPGVGKSRMVAELSSYVEDHPELVTWRQGRCLPYGDGITYWALGEIVKAQAGILESDSPEQVGEKLDASLRAAGPLEPREADWLKARLSTLVGAASSLTAEQEESFTAWRRFLETIAGNDPAVYVFEDVHWADTAMLAFIEHLADWSEGVSMVLVATARPEFLERNPGWGTGLRNATTMNLTPLSEEETGRLIAELLGQAVLPAEVQTPILERAGGNPLYAEEFIRMLKDRELLTRTDHSWRLEEDAEIPFPDGVQGLISARLDTLSATEKALLQDAAVIGKVFWVGALAAMADRDDGALRAALHDLTRKEFVRADRRSSMEGESEFGFWHMLVRDVVYAQIPRADRAAKHVAAAEWIEGQAGERAEDLADVLAHHYVEALELVRSSGGETDALLGRALHFLILAADRARSLDVERAIHLYERALVLAPLDGPARPEIQVALAGTLSSTNRWDRAQELLDRALASFRAAGRSAKAAAAGMNLALVVSRVELSSSHGKAIDAAIAELEALEPGPELVGAYSARASYCYTSSSDLDAVAWADRALSLAERLGLPLDPRALMTRGGARSLLGDRRGFDDLREAIRLAEERGLVGLAAWGHNELSNALAVSEGPAAALAELQVGVDLARRCGHPAVARDLESFTRQELLYDLGRWDELLVQSAGSLAEDQEALDPESKLECRIEICDVSTWRGDLPRARDVAEGLVDDVLNSGEPQNVVSGLDVVAHLALASGEVPHAASLLHDLEVFPNVRESWNYAAYLPEMVRIAVIADGLAFAELLSDGVPERSNRLSQVSRRMVDAELAEARGELDRAADLYAEAEEGWRVFSVPERAQALLGRGRCLLEVGDPHAEGTLRDARDAFASLRADRFLPDVDGLLERAVRLTS